MEKPWKVVFAFVAVFIAGAVFGGLFTLRASGGRRPPGFGFANFDRSGGPNGPGGGWQKQGGQFSGPGAIGPGMLGQLSRNLKLTEEQKEKIRPVVLKAAEDIQRLSRENIQNTTKIVERMHLDIATWLTPKQRDALEDMKLQMRERVRRAGMGEVSPRGEGPQRRMPGQSRTTQSEAAPAPSGTSTPTPASAPPSP
jgi:Spy/CpxP family protein refolding chaperone